MGSRGRSIRLRIYFLVAIPLITMLGLFAYVAYTSVTNFQNLDRAPGLIKATSVPMTQFVASLYFLFPIASCASTTNTLDVIKTNVFRPPAQMRMCVTSGLVGQPGEPSLKTMYVPIRAVKNMISVPRKSHIPSFPLGIGTPILRVGTW